VNFSQFSVLFNAVCFKALHLNTVAETLCLLLLNQWTKCTQMCPWKTCPELQKTIQGRFEPRHA